MTPNPMCVASFATVVCTMQGRWKVRKSGEGEESIYARPWEAEGFDIIPADIGRAPPAPTALYASV